MNTAVAIFGSSVLAAAITAVFTFIANRRKLSADATKIITEAASGVVERLESENARQATTISTQGDRIKVLEEKEEANEVELRKLRRELEEDRRMMQAVVQTVQLHASYDTIVIEKYTRGDRDPLPPAPPLLPPDFPITHP